MENPKVTCVIKNWDKLSTTELCQKCGVTEYHLYRIKKVKELPDKKRGVKPLV